MFRRQFLQVLASLIPVPLIDIFTKDSESPKLPKGETFRLERLISQNKLEAASDWHRFTGSLNRYNSKPWRGEKAYSIILQSCEWHRVCKGPTSYDLKWVFVFQRVHEPEAKRAHELLWPNVKLFPSQMESIYGVKSTDFNEIDFGEPVVEVPRKLFVVDEASTVGPEYYEQSKYWAKRIRYFGSRWPSASFWKK